MNNLAVVYYLFFTSVIAVAAAVNTSQTITHFVNGLSLSSADSRAIQGRLLGNVESLEVVFSGASIASSIVVQLACYTAQIVLGTSAVASAGNQTEVEGTWSEACWEAPTCTILPNSDQDVSLAVKIVNFFQTKFAVRSGGHSPNPGWSSIGQPGILIDLKQLNEITVSSDAAVVSLGPGNRWGSVYSALAPYEVTVIGGRINDVGVGGLILGGGLFHLSGEFGLAADNVQNFHVVLANGTIIDANSDQNTDLFWALKGGGPNFGIVTRYDLYTIPVYNLWFEVLYYTPDQVPDVLDAFAEWQTNGASVDNKSTVAMVISLDSVVVGLLYSQPTATQPAAFAPFYDLNPAEVALAGSNGTITELMELFGETGSTAAERHDYRSASSKVDAELYKEIYAFWVEQATSVYNQTGANQTFVLQPIPGSLIDAGNARGGNPLGLPYENMQWWTTLIDWVDAADDDLVRGVSIATTEKWQSLATARGSASDFIYMNDASRDQNPLGTYGSSNLAQLKAIAEKYDPSKVFQRLQNGGFLLSTA
ncbi:6-hydroxy-D-nicotine oxidase, putative [Talaromyces stipitatus ATCC 10500]|uniref:6-hydroxy-D-nicotine oxidase, putative n=1 Tax=Talaromyces stipitatus (strain ATCC 10500 / CBS 375.48 / QM 6759 / NRRL 1006) TaxID=441959 RepID=B8MSH6_TALSN|nr:6-hydroxy-D-nicotine oxidase, putative [Talaromyces stipitatus ATCC 10500]EED12004.1 6-hydroxy-D-nicotine oxidase, putative [Talaromyces stipitatus ATCC 10500]